MDALCVAGQMKPMYTLDLLVQLVLLPIIWAAGILTYSDSLHAVILNQLESCA